MAHELAGSTESMLKALRADGRSPVDAILHALSDRLALDLQRRGSVRRQLARKSGEASPQKPLWAEMRGLPGERA